MMMSVAKPAERLRETAGHDVLWSSGFGEDGHGTITVAYGGQTASFSVRVRKPTATGNPKLLPDYFGEFSVPRDWDYVDGMIKYLLAPDKGGRQGEVLKRLSATAQESAPRARLRGSWRSSATCRTSPRTDFLAVHSADFDHFD